MAINGVIGSSITVVAFNQGGTNPATYNGALFFADHTRNEIWAMLPGTNGLPDPTKLQSFVCVDSAGVASGHPVDLKIGTGGDLDPETAGVVMVPFLLAGLITGLIARSRPTRWGVWLYPLVVFGIALVVSVISDLGRATGR